MDSLMDDCLVDFQLTEPRIFDRYDCSYVRDHFRKLNEDLINILTEKPVLHSLSELYNIVEKLCFLQQDVLLCKTQQHIIENYLSCQVTELDKLHNESFLQNLRVLWLSFKEKIVTIRNIFTPLEVTIFRNHRKRINFNQICFDEFNSFVIQDQRIYLKLAFLFDLIDQKRDLFIKCEVDNTLLQDIVMMLSSLQLYNTYFEINYLARAVAYYLRERDELLNTGHIVDYLIRVQERLLKEKTMVREYFQVRTVDKVIHGMKLLFIENALPDIMKQLKDWDLFSTGTTDDITIVYDQLKYLIRANDDLCKTFSKYMIAKGRSIITETKCENTMIQNLLDFKDRIDTIIAISFDNSYMYIDTVRMAFKKFINLRKNKPAQLLAKYIDGKMRDKMIPEYIFDKIIVIFRYLQCKDVFEAYYKRYLARRLLLGKSSSQDAERSMISKLKYECGDDFTSKLEGMFKDIDLSDGLLQAFKQRGGDRDNIEFSAQVLTCSFWPTFNKYKLILPDSMLFYQNVYHEFYKSKYTGRSLEWTGTLDTCLVKAHFDKGTKELQLSLFQTCILLLFNDLPQISYGLLVKLLNLDGLELDRTLTSLLASKVDILKIIKAESTNREPSQHNQQNSIDKPNTVRASFEDLTLTQTSCTNLNTVDEKTLDVGNVSVLSTAVLCGPEFLNEDVFVINHEFQHKLYRIKVNQLQYKDTTEEEKITEEGVLHDRHLQIDAAIVRIMKEHRELKHNNLLTKMFGALKFPVNPCDIKKRIETLIERDFLARNPNDQSSYLYVA